METSKIFSNGNHTGKILKRLNNGHCLPTPKGTDFFGYLKSKTSSKIYESLYHYMKTITQKLEDEQTVYILDLADILWKVQLWKEKLPGVKIFYAIKANSDPVLMRLLVLLGFSYDCSTKGEIKFVLENGGDPKDIIYAHTVKPPTSLRYASAVGVELMTFDSVEELLKIHKHYPSAKLVIRIKPENPPRVCESSESKSCAYNLGEKYGCLIQDAAKLLQQAVTLNLNVVGVSFHVGAICDDPSSYATSINNCRLVFDIAQQLGFNFEIIDIGAGFCGSDVKEKFFDVVTTQIKVALTEHFPDKKVNIIAEPGCYLVASAQRHITCVIGKRSTNSNTGCTENDEIVQRQYFLNDGFYNNFFKEIQLYDVYPRLLVTYEELKKRPIYKSKIWGQTCCSEDVIQEESLLPDLDVGEYLVWENMGAYTQGVSSTFTLVPPALSKHVFILNSRLQLEWIENLDEIAEFLIKNTVLIESEKFY